LNTAAQRMMRISTNFGNLAILDCLHCCKGLISAVAILLCLVMGACGPLANTTINPEGDYRGSATRFQVLRPTCPRPGLLNISVRNGIMFYKWENQFIQVSVLSNGTLSGALPGVQLNGTHDGTIMQGNVTDGQCGLHFTLKRVGT
jgi:hypothetical protein